MFTGRCLHPLNGQTVLPKEIPISFPKRIPFKHILLFAQQSFFSHNQLGFRGVSASAWHLELNSTESNIWHIKQGNAIS